MRIQTIAVLFGGQSAEHDVSIQSASYVAKALTQAGFRIWPIWISPVGVWHRADSIAASPDGLPVAMLPAEQGLIRFANSGKPAIQADLVFPVLHGPLGEDGSVQGLLRLCQVPFVGCDVLASAICMDKTFTRRLLRSAGLPMARALALTANDSLDFESAAAVLGSPMFIKPANMGSSIGVSKASDPDSYRDGLSHAFEFDRTVLIEEQIVGREIECAVLCDPEPRASVPGEIGNSSGQFYSYREKYGDESTAALSVPAQIDAEMTLTIQSLAITAAQLMNCEGLVRVDFFLSDDGSITVNELNTMPGFTAISMFPRLWEASGMTNAGIVQTLVDQARIRFIAQSQLRAKPATETSQPLREAVR